ncbi:unnamed protein product [Ectocarpus sp. 13 AM-2016]
MDAEIPLRQKKQITPYQWTTSNFVRQQNTSAGVWPLRTHNIPVPAQASSRQTMSHKPTAVSRWFSSRSLQKTSTPPLPLLWYCLERESSFSFVVRIFSIQITSKRYVYVPNDGRNYCM